MKKFILFALVILTQCAWEWPSGWDLGVIKPASVINPGLIATTNQTLTAAQSGNTIVFNNSTGVAKDNTKFTLPTAQVGLNYTFIADYTKYMTIMPQSTDTINFSTLTAGQGLKNTSAAIGDSITLECRTAAKWSIKNKVGTWALGV